VTLTGKTTEELVEMRRAIESDLRNQQTAGGAFPYTRPAMKKLDEIDRAIAALVGQRRGTGLWSAPVRSRRR
jgi:hypothetical protein